jgi:hypothetical protein
MKAVLDVEVKRTGSARNHGEWAATVWQRSAVGLVWDSNRKLMLGI